MAIQRYKPAQIVSLLRQIEVSIGNGKATPQACNEAGITVQTYYRWRKEWVLCEPSFVALEMSRDLPAAIHSLFYVVQLSCTAESNEFFCLLDARPDYCVVHRVSCGGHEWAPQMITQPARVSKNEQWGGPSAVVGRTGNVGPPLRKRVCRRTSSSLPILDFQVYYFSTS